MTEIVNNMLKLKRRQNVIKLLDSIWQKVMTIRFTRMCKAIREQNDNRQYTPYCAQLVNDSRAYSGGMLVNMSSDIEARVVSLEGYIYIVRLDLVGNNRSCHCDFQRLQKLRVPYGHAMAVIFHQQRDLAEFLPH